MVEAGDNKRVETVITKIKHLASENNLDCKVAEQVYRTMIRAFIELEAAKVNPLYKEIKQSYY